MERMSFFSEPRGQRLLCALLVLALLMMLLPAGKLRPAQLADPISDDPLPDLGPLQLGDGQDAPSEPLEVTEPTEPGQETRPSETQPQDAPQPDPGDEEEGRDEGNQGDEGGEEAAPELALVMTWYRYGSQPRTIVCGPSETVSKSLNTAQLVGGELKYSFALTGRESDGCTILGAEVQAGDSVFRELGRSGSVSIDLPDGGTRDYTFRIRCETEQGEELWFTYVLHCAHAADLELELSWLETDGSRDTLLCAPNDTAEKTVKTRDLTEHVFSYTPKLTGSAAESAALLRGYYSTASGEGGELNLSGGTMVLQTGEVYELTFEASHEDMTIFFRFTITYSEAADVILSFTWLERGSIRRTMLCQPDAQASSEVRSNQLSAGAVKYELALEGEDAPNARILNISYTSASGGGRLDASGSIPMTLPDGASENLYTILVSVLVNGQQLRYEILLRYSMDVSLEMTYTLADGAVRTILCENGKTKTAEPIYDDQLSEGLLTYQMKLTGSAGAGMTITSVRCYQSGSGRTVPLEPSDSLQLLLKNGRTGENTFAVTAEDTSGTQYRFTISIPYKHRGEKTVKIAVNLRDGQTVINEAELNLAVSAWTEDGAGNVIGYIPANGTDTTLAVTFDGETVRYASTSGNASEYILYPSNPATGDTNEHTLHIYAEDAYGNYGELSLTLRGQRNQSGQKTGTATIYVDMTVLGLGIVDSVSYDVLADEPISYSIAKAVFGMDLGHPYGAAADTLGWQARYTGTLDEGFYLQSLTPGVTGHALNGGSWSQYGSNEQEVLDAIDSYFGRGTGLAALWRCIYRNGLNKSSGSGGTYGEFDYTSGSGWLFSLDGVYYPGLSMCQYSLRDGDVLTLRYTLAYGWDVGGGTAGYGNTAGYCVTALNGSYTINHQMQTVEHADGSLSYMCRCCGLVEECAHANSVYTDLGDGTHATFCSDCRKIIGDPAEHIWTHGDTKHVCTACAASQEHTWKEVDGSNTATCTEAGTRTVYCPVCTLAREEESPPRGHSLNSRWNHTKSEHYQKCSVCQETIPQSVGRHSYEYHAGDDDWYCTVCQAGHDWDYCGNDSLTIRSASCTQLVYSCGECGLDLTKNGTFDEYHTFENGICTHCGAADPDYRLPTEPPVTEPPETEPPTQPTKKNRRKEHESQNQ